MRPIPIFMYHHINTNKGDMVTVTLDVFEAQMKFLAEAGCRTLSADELVKSISGNMETAKKAVAITFDDGYLDNYQYAFPILKRYNIKAIIFIVVDWVGKSSELGSPIEAFGGKVRSLELKTKKLPNHNECKRLINEGKISEVIMSWDMVKEMKESGLIEFYSHTMSHKRCAELSPDELSKELRDSKKIIEEKLDKACSYLCWPKGSYNEGAIRIAREIGYKALFTTKRGVVKKDSDMSCIERIVVKDNLLWFKNRVRIYTTPVLSDIYLAVRGKE